MGAERHAPDLSAQGMAKYIFVSVRSLPVHPVLNVSQFRNLLVQPQLLLLPPLLLVLQSVSMTVMTMAPLAKPECSD